MSNPLMTSGTSCEESATIGTTPSKSNSVDPNSNKISQDEGVCESTDAFSPRSTAALALSCIASQSPLEESRREGLFKFSIASDSATLEQNQVKSQLSNETKLYESSGKQGDKNGSLAYCVDSSNPSPNSPPDGQQKNTSTQITDTESKLDVNQKPIDQANLTTHGETRTKHDEVESPQEKKAYETPQASQLRHPPNVPCVVPPYPYPWPHVVQPAAGVGFPPPMWRTPLRNHQSASPLHHQVLLATPIPGVGPPVLVTHCYIPAVYFPPPPVGIAYGGMYPFPVDNDRSPSDVKLNMNNQSQSGAAVTPSPNKKAKIQEDQPGFLPMTPRNPTSFMFQYARPKAMPSYDESATAREHQKEKYNRKHRSLGNLASSFLSHCVMANLKRIDSCRKHISPETQEQDSQPPTEVVIDDLAASLNVERRRIYDVINVLEALQLVMKKAKNTYMWLGELQMISHLARLQMEAIQRWPEMARKNGLTVDNLSSPASDDVRLDIRRRVHKKKKKKEGKEGIAKSLHRLSELFLYMFLAGYSSISLTEASDLIEGTTSSTQEDVAVLGCTNEKKRDYEQNLTANSKEETGARDLKTKIRRLYDIANVFLAVGLLSKQECATSDPDRRPRYSWTYKLSINDIQRSNDESR